MRIVMVTDDGAAIDRRILLEAQTLIEDGHEVILLARQVDGVPASEKIGALKVERLQLNQADVFDPKMRDAIKPFVPRSLVKSAGKVRGGALLAVGMGRFTGRYLAGFHQYLLWNRKQRQQMLAAPGLSWRRRARLRLGAVPRGVQLAGLTTVGGAAWLLSRPFKFLRKSDIEVFAANIWDRAIERRVVYYDPDVIHVHDLPQLYGGALARRTLKVPLIYDSHENYSEIGTLTPEQSRFLKVREKRLLKECAVRITVNKGCAGAIEEQNPGHTFDVIHNATDRPPGFERGKHDDRLRKALNLGPEIKLLMYQGWFSEHGRGLQELIAGMTNVRRDVHLVMMGYGDFDFFGRLVKEADCVGRVHLMKPVPWQELVFWSAAADVGVIPYQEVDKNHRFCSPNKLFEFITAGLPILANDLPFLRHAVQDQGFGIVRPMISIENMTAAINDVFDPTKNYLSAARQCLQQEAWKWEWKEEQKRLREIYKRLPPPKNRYGLRSRRASKLVPLDELILDYANQTGNRRPDK